MIDWFSSRLVEVDVLFVFMMILWWFIWFQLGGRSADITAVTQGFTAGYWKHYYRVRWASFCNKQLLTASQSYIVPIVLYDSNCDVTNPSSCFTHLAQLGLLVDSQHEVIHSFLRHLAQPHT